jgi:hypothetical protein
MTISYYWVIGSCWIVRLCVCLGVIVWRPVRTDGLLTDLVVTGLTDAGQTLCVVAGGDLTRGDAVKMYTVVQLKSQI